jgi:hypothetical protein
VCALTAEARTVSERTTPSRKYSASYRFVEPLSSLTSKIDEVKLRASYGQSGNRPNYGVRDITIASGVIGGAATLVAANRESDDQA